MKQPPLLKAAASVLASSFFWVLTMVIICFSGCISTQERVNPAEAIEETKQEESLSWEILDYRNKAMGETIPRWLNSFLEGGIAAVEKLEEFGNFYVFISMNSGTNINALEQWNAGFSADLDFSRMVAVRIEKRFLEAARTYPDDEYGSFFVAMIRSASDNRWEGAVRDSDFWLLRSFPDADGLAVSRESYDFFILVKIRKALLASQINALFGNIQPKDPLSADQQAAVKRVQDRFFEGF